MMWGNLHRVLQSNLILFVSLSSIFLVYPHVASTPAGEPLLDTLFTLSILVSLCQKSGLAVSLRYAYVAVGVVAIGSTWLMAAIPLLESVVPASYAVFFGSSVVIHFRHLVSGGEVDADTFLGASCTYILIGLCFAAAYAVLLDLDPDSIAFAGESDSRTYQLAYFSFVTMTTVGYGDILPVSDATRMLAVYESIVGQIFVAVVVGLLVGKYVSPQSEPTDSRAMSPAAE